MEGEKGGEIKMYMSGTLQSEGDVGTVVENVT